jgi:hypothetical protein
MSSAVPRLSTHAFAYELTAGPPADQVMVDDTLRTVASVEEDGDTIQVTFAERGVSPRTYPRNELLDITRDTPPLPQENVERIPLIAYDFEVIQTDLLITDLPTPKMVDSIESSETQTIIRLVDGTSATFARFSFVEILRDITKIPGDVETITNV